jgi:hypothetical protein
LKLLELAETTFKECIADINISDLHTAIYLFKWLVRPESPPSLEIRNSLVTALLTRFSYTGEWEDVRAACALRSNEWLPPTEFKPEGAIHPEGVASAIQESLDVSALLAVLSPILKPSRVDIRRLPVRG